MAEFATDLDFFVARGPHYLGLYAFDASGYKADLLTDILPYLLKSEVCRGPEGLRDRMVWARHKEWPTNICMDADKLRRDIEDLRSENADKDDVIKDLRDELQDLKDEHQDLKDELQETLRALEQARDQLADALDLAYE